MIHLSNSLRPVECELVDCELQHYSNPQEARVSADKLVVEYINGKKLDHTNLDSKVRKLNFAVHDQVENLRKVANELGFYIRNYQFKKDLDSFYASLVSGSELHEGKESEVESFRKFYHELENLEKQRDSLEREYYGWARYYKYPNSNAIHYRDNCNKLIPNGFKREVFSSVTPELSGVPFQELLASEETICGFCFPNIKRENKSKASSISCPNSGSIRFESLVAPISFTITQGSCDECKAIVSITKTGKLRAHHYPNSEVNEDLLNVVLAGKENAFSWKVETSLKNNILVVETENKTYSEYLNKRMLNNILKHKESFKEFIKVYGGILTDNIDFQISLNSYSNFEVLSQSLLKAIEKEDNPFIRAELLFFARKYPEENYSSLRRLIYIKHYSDFSYETLGHNGIYALDATKRASLDEVLDFLDYLHNGNSGETYKSFREENRGRLYPTVEKNSKQYFTFGRGDVNFSLRTLYLATHRYHQMAKRSQKLKKTLDNLPLNELLNALDSEIPGWLLVNDTIAMIESAKEDRGLGKGYAGRQTWRNYQAQEIYRDYGEELARKVDELDRVQDFLKYVYSEKFIEEARWLNKKSFVIHAVNTLGVEEFLHIMSIVYHESEGITSRGFNRLVNQGGFLKDDTPEAWQILLINW